MNRVLKNIRYNNIKDIIPNLIALIIAIIIFIGSILLILDGKYLAIIMSIVFGIFNIFQLKIIIGNLKLIIKPESSDVFEKYGSPDKVLEIIEKTEEKKEYEDRNIIISKDYILVKRDLSKLVACKDVLGAHKLIYKRNGLTHHLELIIINKFGQEIMVKYRIREEETIHSILAMFAVLCPNAKIGYTREERENIINKVETLPSQKKYEYKCDKCGAKVSANAKKCPKCGELFEED